MSVVKTTSCDHFFSSKHFSRAPWAGSELTLARDGGGVQGHRLGLRLLPVDLLVAVEAVHLVVGSVGEVPWIHLMFAFGAGEAFPVIASRLSNLLLGFEDFACASR